VRLTFQSVIEEIVCEELGRGRYERRSADSPEGYRNGWQQPRTLKTSLGPVQLQRPKLRHAHAALCDRLFGQGGSRTNALETLVISCWVRGLSDRDVEAMLVEVFGQDATISRTTCSRICQRLRAEFDIWCRRDLAGTKIDYLYLDGSFFKMHPRPRPSRCWWPGHRHLRQAGVPGPWPGRGRVDRCLAGAAGRPHRPRPSGAAAGHLRRR
jgi:transposase-like protein